jgi:pimeloyl-ACP methyl ester carboxylesterase
VNVSRGEATLSVDLAGKGPHLLYLHGLLSNAAIARREAPAGFSVATFDQRGHGDGPRFVDGAAYEIGEFVADALAVLDALGWERATIGGTSMGAAVALRLALDHPPRVDSLLLAGPAYDDVPLSTVPFHDEIANDLEELGSLRAADHRRQLMLARGFPEEACEWLSSWGRHDGFALAAATRAVARWVPFPDIDRVAELAMPMVLVGWPDDPLHPLPLAQRLAALAHTRVALLDGAAAALASPEAISLGLSTLSGAY